MSLSEVDSLARAQALLTAVEILVAVHETCSEAVWLANLYAIWSGHGFDFEPVRPLAELIVALSGPVARRVAIASYAVVTPEDAHTQADLIAAVKRAAGPGLNRRIPGSISRRSTY
jgi:hypothetical protein